MKIKNTIEISRPSNQVWKVLAEEFDQIQNWCSNVRASYKKTTGIADENAPMVGRICEFSTKPNGPMADETIAIYDQGSKILGVNVLPKNTKIPVEKNDATFCIQTLDNGSSMVTICSNIELKAVGKILYPVVKAGISKSFNGLLKELKYYLEHGVPMKCT